MRKVLLSLFLVIVLSLAGCAASDASFPVGDPVELMTEYVEPTMIPEVTEMMQVLPENTEALVPTEPHRVAERISEGVSVNWGQMDSTHILCDGSYHTKRAIHSLYPFSVSSELPFGAVYIEWDQTPGEYSIVWDGGSISCGTYGFLHEYIFLPESVNAIEIVFPDSESRVICEVQLYTEGLAPEGVQAWLPPCETADILVFPTHSDDDVLFFGALMSYYSIERKLVVQTAFMVEHNCRWERNHERLNGLWEMGIRNYPILGSAPDTSIYDLNFGLQYYAASDIPGWQIEQIRRFKPLVVVGHDLEGEYGNSGHKVNAYYLTQTVFDAADPEKYPESAERYGTWDTPKLYLHLYPEDFWYFDVNIPMKQDPENRTPFEVAEDAFSHHRSQLKYGYRVEQSDDNPAFDCRRFGLYRSLVGNDSVADIMDHIDPAQWR